MSAPVRIQRQRTKGWRAPLGTVYVGRPTPWGNPFRAPIPPDEAVQLYRELVVDGVTTYDGHVFERREAKGPLHVPTVAQIRRALAGRDIACWCPLDGPCHGDVLLELANTPEETT